MVLKTRNVYSSMNVQCVDGISCAINDVCFVKGDSCDNEYIVVVFKLEKVNVLKCLIIAVILIIVKM